MIKIANNLEKLSLKESTFKKDVAKFFNPFSNNLTNYVNSGLIGGIGGGIISAFIEDFKKKEEQNYLKAILTGGGIGAGVGLGAKGLGDAFAGDEAQFAREIAEQIELFKSKNGLR